MGQNKITAFFSYARDDQRALADAKIVEGIARVLETQTHANLSEVSFTVWRDVENLRWGDQWRDKLLTIIPACDLFIPLVSPRWFASEFCQLEFQTFRSAGAERYSAILPINWRDAPANRLPAHLHGVHATLRDSQFADWTTLADATQEDRDRIYRTAAKDLATKIHDLGLIGRPQAPSAASSLGAPSSSVAHPVADDMPVVSGDLLIPSQGGGGVMARLIVAELAEVVTARGSIVFSIAGLTLFTRVTGGRITDEEPRFGGAGHRGPVAHVRRTPANPSTSAHALMITAHDGALSGEPLVAAGEAGHVRLFDVDPDGSEAIAASGEVRLSLRAVSVDTEESDLDEDVEEALAADQKAARAMKLALAELVLAQCGAVIPMQGTDHYG
jgi:hypothetical protein